MSLNDPTAVREQYATEAGLAARRAVYDEVSGPDPRDAAEQIRSYLRSSRTLARGADRVPELTEPLVARRRPVVFVAEKAA